MPAANSQKNLLLDSTIFDLQPDGGISRYWYELVSNLALRHGEWAITLFTDPNTTNKFGRKLIAVTSNKDHVRIQEYAPRQLGRFFGPRLTDRYARSLWHSSYYRVPLHSHIASVCTVHDFIYETYFTGTSAWLLGLKKRRAILRASEIICVSENTKRDLLERYPKIDSARCHVIYHGRSHSFAPRKDCPPGAISGAPYVLFVGSRVGYKNFGLVVRAVETVTGHELVIAGGGKLSPPEISMLHQRLPGRYRIFETPSDESLCELYQGATALAYLSQYEGFGFPPLEAMACGCPVIAMHTSSIPEVVDDAGILLSSERLDDVRDAIKIAGIHERRMAMIEKGLKRAGLFSWDRAVDRTIEVYERALTS